MATAQELIQDARSFANNIMGQAQNWLGAATQIASSYYQPVSRETINVQKLDVEAFDIGAVPTFNATFTMPTGEPTIGSMTPMYVPSLPSFGDRPSALDTSNLFQVDAPSLELPEFDYSAFPDINTDWDIPVAPVIAFPDAPEVTPIDITPVSLNLPTILDPDQFVESYSSPVSDAGELTLIDVTVPERPTMPDAPAPLDTSGLFQTLKPTFELGALDAAAPDIDLSYTMPTAPIVTFPDAPTLDDVTAQDITIALPTVEDYAAFSGDYVAPASAPDAPNLMDFQSPEAVVFPDAPAALDKSGLFNTAKPEWSLGELDAQAPDINTAVTMPEAPLLVMPEAPEVSPVTIADVSLTLPEVTDYSAFSGAYVPPSSAPVAPTLSDVTIPEGITLPSVPSALQTEGLFADAKPTWSLADFTVSPPDVDTDIAFPDAPDIAYPDAPVPTIVTLTDPSITLPTIDDPEQFTGGDWSPQGVAPTAPVLTPLQLPEETAFPNAPAPLDTSGLFQTEKPVYDVPVFDIQEPSLDTSTVLPDVPVIDYPDAPELTEVTISDVSLSLPDIADAPTFSGIYTAPTSAPVAPTYEAMQLPDSPIFSDAPAPLDTSGLFQDAKPSWTLSDFATPAPDITTDFDLPSAPIIDYPEAPVIGELQLGDAPTITLPTFDAQFSGTEPEALSGLSEQFAQEAASHRTLLAQFVDSQLADWCDQYALPNSVVMKQSLVDKLSSGLAGGTGLSDSFEADLYSRARARIDAEQSSAYTQTQNVLSKRGYVYPAGAQTAALNNLVRDYANRLAEFARETAIERAKMEIQHAQFIMSTVSALHQAAQQAAVGYAGILVQLNGQAVEYAKVFVAQLVEIYNGALEVYKAKMSLWQTQAQVFETQLKAALSGLDKYRLELEAAKARKDIDAMDVQLYEARMSALSKKIEVYATQVNAVQIAANLERMKIELFNGQVEAYLGQVKAQEAKYGAYRAAVEGDTAKVQGYLAQVEGYKAEVDAESKKSDVAIARSRAVLDYNAGLSDQYKAGLQRYQSDIDAERARFSSSVEAYRAELDGYQAAIRAKIDRLNAEIEQARINLEIVKARKDIDQIEVQIYSSRLQALSTKAQIYEAQLKGVESKIGIERVKLDLYDGQIKAYLARVEAEQGKFTAFRVATEADSARIEGYRSEVGAYSAQVDAAGKRSDIGIARSRLAIEHNQALNDAYKAELQRYQTDIDAEKARVGTLIDAYRAQLDGYQAAIKAKLDRVNAEIEEARLTLETAKTRKDMDQLDVQIYTAKVQALSTKAEIYATQLKAISSRVDVEKLKIDVYDGQVRAYSALTDAQQGKFTAFKTLTDADSARVSAGAESYRTQVDALAKGSDIDVSLAKLSIEQNQALTDQYRAGVDVYRADIQAEQARMGVLVDVYRAGLEAYQAALKAKLDKVNAELDQARLNIEIAKAKKDVEKTEVDIYVARIQALSTQSDLYQAQLKGVTTQLEAERLKLDVYDGLVKAYATRADAEQSKFGAYKTAIDADTAFIQAYGAEVDAYRAQVDAATKRGEFGVEVAKLTFAQNQDLNERYRIGIERYKADVEAERTRMAALVDSYRAGLDGYKASVDAKIERVRADIEQSRLNIELVKTRSDLNEADVRAYVAMTDAQTKRLEVYLAQLNAVKTQADIEKTKIDVYDSQVKAYLTKAQAEEAKFSAFKTVTDADVARIQGYNATIEAYKAQVDAAGKVADIDVQIAESGNKHNQALISAYSARLDKYKLDIEAERTRFGAAVEAYKSSLEGYRTAIEGKMKLLEAEIKEAELNLETAKAQTVVDQAEVAVYSSRIEGLRSQIGVYAAQIDAIKSRAETERLKVDIFDGKVKAYIGAIEGEKAKFSAYEAAIRGDTARVQGYNAQIEAYKAGVDAEAKKADVDMERGRMIMETNRNVLAQYTAELDAYKAKLQTAITRFGGESDAYKAALSGYQAELSAKAQVLDAQVKAKAIELDIARVQAEANLQVNTTNATLAQKGLEMTTHAAIAAGQASGAMAQSALSGLNSLAVVDASNEDNP